MSDSATEQKTKRSRTGLYGLAGVAHNDDPAGGDGGGGGGGGGGAREDDASRPIALPPAIALPAPGDPAAGVPDTLMSAPATAARCAAASRRVVVAAAAAGDVSAHDSRACVRTPCLRAHTHATCSGRARALVTVAPKLLQRPSHALRLAGGPPPLPPLPQTQRPHMVDDDDDGAYIPVLNLDCVLRSILYGFKDERPGGERDCVRAQCVALRHCACVRACVIARLR